MSKILDIIFLITIHRLHCYVTVFAIPVKVGISYKLRKILYKLTDSRFLGNDIYSIPRIYPNGIDTLLQKFIFISTKKNINPAFFNI